jgi:hypothetical protein
MTGKIEILNNLIVALKRRNDAIHLVCEPPILKDSERGYKSH